MSGKLPAFQFYPADWRKDPGVQSLTFHQRGVWFEIICLMHESPSRGYLLLPTGKAISDEQLGRLIGLDKQNTTAVLTALIDGGVASRDPDTGALVNRRMVRDEQLRQIRKKAGSKGGNPVLLNQEVNQNPTTQVNQNPTPSSSSSTTVDKERESMRVAPSKGMFPTVEEAKEFCKGQLLPTDHVEEWHSNRNAQGWVRGNGQPILSWGSDLKSWIYRSAREQSGKPSKAKTPEQSKYAGAF